jgi:hypothetical protein
MRKLRSSAPSTPLSPRLSALVFGPRFRTQREAGALPSMSASHSDEPIGRPMLSTLSKVA